MSEGAERMKDMAREKEAYRDNLERIHERYPDKEFLTVSDVSSFLGCCRAWCKRNFPFKGNYISKATLARELS